LSQEQQNLKFRVEPADRIKRLPPYLFGRLNALKHAKRQAGVDIIDLGMGNPTDAPPAEVVEKLCEVAKDTRSHRYSASAGIPHLRRRVADDYAHCFGVELDPDSEVIACIGSKEGYSHLCLGLLGPGDTVVMGDPAYPVHIYAAALAGANVIRVPLGADPTFLERVAGVIETLYPRPKVLVLNYPHNPTSMTVERPFFDSVVALARRFGVMVIHDFAYGKTTFDGYEAPSFLAADGAKEVGVELTTMSKPFNMAGWRIGFCAGNPQMIQALATVKGYYDYGIFVPIQVASIIALRDCREIPQHQAKVYQGRRDVMCRGLERIGWQVEIPRAGMFVWAKPSEEDLSGRGTIDFAMWLLDAAEVAVAPGGGFGENGEGFLRIALVENEHRLTQAIRQIDRALRRDRPAPSTNASPVTQ
jgi:alanine-synthesizing transaminase